jgi:very-short-patch-repair endonuclease
MANKCATADPAIAKIAARQHGVVSAKQLAEAGLGRSTISKRAHDGRLHRVHHGVYAVGHPITHLRGRWMAAVLACGDGAVLSHRSAAALWELLRPMSGPIDVSVPTTGGRRRRDGIRLHRRPSLQQTKPIQSTHLPNEGALDGLVPVGLVTIRHNIPVTTPARTVTDLKACVAPRLHRRAIRQAELAGFALGADVKTDGTRSDLERHFLALCRRAGLPAPEVNVRVGRWTVDFLWPAHKLAVETDSYRFHRGAIAFEDDRARDLDLRRRGFKVHRFTERQLEEDASGIVADLRDALHGRR